MGYYLATNTDWEILTQQNKELYSKVELLNSNYKIINNIEGNLISDDLSIDANSNVRRTYNCTIHVTDATFDISRDKAIWFNRIIRPYIGVKHQRTNKIVWYLMGTYMITGTSTQYDAENNTLKINCSDLMFTLEAQRTQLNGYTFTIPAGEDVRTSIIGLLKDAGIKKYKVGSIKEEIPYDLEYDVGTSTYDILKDILELYDGWEMYFDIDGTFVYDMIPTCYEDDISIDNETIQNLLISEDISTDLTGVYNKTIVWGDIIEPDFYSDSVTYSSGVYKATVEQYINTTTSLKDPTAYSSYENGDKVALKIPSANTVKSYINLNGLGNVPICDDSGDFIDLKYFKANTVYCFKYRKSNPKGVSDFYLLGQFLPYGEYTETDKDVEFSTVNLGQTFLQVLNEESCYSDDLCRQRAEYETWLKCRRKTTISLSMVAIFWLDVNTKIEYIPTGQDKPIQYIVNSISINSAECTMSVNLSKFYEQYQIVYNKKYL